MTVNGTGATMLVGQGRGSRRFSDVPFQGRKIDDHIIFNIPTFLYFFNHDWAKSLTFFNLTTFILLQSYNNVNSNSDMS